MNTAKSIQKIVIDKKEKKYMTNTKSNWRAKRRTKRLIVITSLVLAVALTIGLTFAFWQAGIETATEDGRFGIQVGYGESVTATISLTENDAIDLYGLTEGDDITVAGVVADDADFQPLGAGAAIIPRGIPLSGNFVWAIRFEVDVTWTLGSDDPSLAGLRGILNGEVTGFLFEMPDNPYSATATNPHTPGSDDYNTWNTNRPANYAAWNTMMAPMAALALAGEDDYVDVYEFNGYQTRTLGNPTTFGTPVANGLFLIALEVETVVPDVWIPLNNFEMGHGDTNTVAVRVTITMNIPQTEYVYHLVANGMGDLVLEFDVQPIA